jgi:aminopeptidase-like protein
MEKGVPTLAVQGLGTAMFDLCADLFPILRSITGSGVRETLDRIGSVIPLSRLEVPSGTPALDWTVPPEWNVTDAFVKDRSGRRVIDFRRSNLHLVSYSTPVRARLTLDELRPHLFTLPDRPDLIPYRTSYYEQSWGFCLTERELRALEPGDYDVLIDSTLAPGALTYAECVLPGSGPDEVVISSHVCHPSLANDNLSGISVVSHLAQLLGSRELRHTYRFLFMPGTIGSIVWLSRNEALVPRIRHGLVVTGVGDRSPLTYKRSRRGTADIDRAFEHVLRREGDAKVVDFTPYGYDERQFCSPGFDLPFGRICRAVHGEHSEYHTSADNLSFIDPEQLESTLRTLLDVVEVLEGNERYRNLQPRGEPQLGRRGLYRTVGGDVDKGSVELALLWVLNLSDGAHDLLDIANRAGLSFAVIRRAADVLLAHDLLGPDDGAP